MVVGQRHSEARGQRVRGLSRLGAVAAAVGLTATLAACGGGSGSSAAPAGAPASAPASASAAKVDSIAAMLPESIKSKGTLVVAAGVYPPAVIQPTGGAAPTGWDIENARQIAGVLGLTPEFKIIPFDGVIAGLAANRYDAAVGEIYITPERTAQVTFVTNHRSADALMVKADSAVQAAGNKDALCGLTIAAELGSVEATVVDDVAKECAAQGKPAATLKTFKAQAEVNLALDGGRVDAAVSSASQIANVLKETPNKFRLVELPWAPQYDTGMALARNADSAALAKAVAAATDSLIKDGSLQKTLDEFNAGEGGIDQAKILPAPAAS